MQLLEVLERVSWEITPEAVWQNQSFCCSAGSKKGRRQKATHGQISAAEAEHVVFIHPLGL